jgi:hypothetical protein
VRLRAEEGQGDGNNKTSSIAGKAREMFIDRQSATPVTEAYRQPKAKAPCAATHV